MNNAAKSIKTDQEYTINITKLGRTAELKEDNISSVEEISKKTPKIVNANRILMKSKRILREIRKKLLLREYQKTKTRNIQFVNDITMELNQNDTIKKNKLFKINAFFLIIYLKFSKFLFNLFALMAQTLIIWRFLYIFIMIITCFYITIEVFIKSNTNFMNLPIYDIMFWMMFCKFIIEFLIAKAHNQDSLKNLCLKSFNFRFFFDLTSFIILLLLISQSLTATNLWILLYLLQLQHVKPFYTLIMRKIFIYSNLQQSVILIGFVIKTLVLAHFLACFSYYFSHDNHNNEYFSWNSDYLSYLHESLSLLFLINNSNIQSNTSQSIGFQCISILISGFWFIYILKAFLMVFIEKKSNFNDIYEQDHYQIFINCMKKLQMRKDLILKIKDYLEKLNLQCRPTLISLTENQAFNKLSAELKDDFLSATQMKIFGNLPILYKNFSEAFLRNLLPKMAVVHYNPENIIYHVFILNIFIFIIFFSKEIRAQ